MLPNVQNLVAFMFIPMFYMETCFIWLSACRLVYKLILCICILHFFGGCIQLTDCQRNYVHVLVFQNYKQNIPVPRIQM